MNIKEILKETGGVFLPPEKVKYFGKLYHGAPYFEPINFVPSVIRVRKLIKRTPEEIAERNERWKHNKNKPDHLYSNMPMVRRAKNKIVKIFGVPFYITWGWPVAVQKVGLGWKDKYESPRFEWSPQFHIFFFGLQYCEWWNAPKIEGEKWPDNDKYYEMMLWYLKYSDKNIKKAEETWGWTNYDTKESSWKKDYLLQEEL